MYYCNYFSVKTIFFEIAKFKIISNVTFNGIGLIVQIYNAKSGRTNYEIIQSV